MVSSNSRKKTRLTRIEIKGLVIFVRQIAGWSVIREVTDAFLGEDPHVDLEAEQCEDGEGEERQDDDIAEILHWLDHSSHDSLQTCRYQYPLL